MAISKPSIPKGTRDFTPVEMSGRNYIFQTIRNVFENYGYMPVETPAMENLTTLLGKYGEEGDKLLFRILNSGDFLKNTKAEELQNPNFQTLSSQICDRGLRYDLTVPFARFVVQHRHEITFPFKRYQMQPVWRADRPQKGRYREFYQCDVDVIGSNSLINESELINIIDEVFEALRINVVIKLNNRKVLAGIVETLLSGENIGKDEFENILIDFTVSLDKIDKIGIEGVWKELMAKGFNEQNLTRLEPLLEFQGDFPGTLKFLNEFVKDSEAGVRGVEELEKIYEYTRLCNLTADLELDLSLARGLNYYTGAIIEVKSKDVKIGSICGGGRYDDLTGIFGMPDVSGVGISFGADRIYDVLNQLDGFPEKVSSSLDLLFVNFGEKEEKYIIPLLAKVRREGISAELYPDQAKMKKQMTYANNNSIPFVAIIGEDEISNSVISLKNMITGEQKRLTLKELVQILKS